jgi:two-component system, LuxR family, response regulator FixJ
MADEIHVAIIDDDQAVLDSLRLYFTRHELAVACFSGPTEFLAALDAGERFDCIVCDVRMPTMSGIDLLDNLIRRGCDWPTILMTGHGDVPMAVAAIKKGAFDFIDKPFNASQLLASIHDAVTVRRQSATRHSELSELRNRLAALSSRQREVMDLVVAGLSNKEIALRLDISPRTVDHHRAWVMERMGAKNLADLVRQAVRLQGNAA